MIEVAPSDFWKLNVTHSEAQLYCFMLQVDGKKGWRLPTQQEADEMVDMIHDTRDRHAHIDFEDLSEFSEYWADFDSLGMWTHEDDINMLSDTICDAIPVRDI